MIGKIIMGLVIFLLLLTASIIILFNFGHKVSVDCEKQDYLGEVSYFGKEINCTNVKLVKEITVRGDND